jgi:hypothetical protein
MRKKEMVSWATVIGVGLPAALLTIQGLFVPAALASIMLAVAGVMLISWLFGWCDSFAMTEKPRLDRRKKSTTRTRSCIIVNTRPDWETSRKSDTAAPAQ